MSNLMRVTRLGLIAALLPVLLPSVGAAQVMRVEAWGFAFTAPAGWTPVQQDAEGALLVSPDQSTLLLVEPHDIADRDALLLAAARGYQNTGVVLTATTSVSET